MRYSAPLLDFDDKDKPTISNDHWSLLTAAQRSKFDLLEHGDRPCLFGMF